MPDYVVSYDLTRPGQNYPELWKALESLGGKRVLLSQWAVHAKGPAEALRDWLTPHIDSTDRLLVMDVNSGDWASLRALVNLNQF